MGKEFKRILQELRAEKNWTQEDLAKQLKTTKAAVSHYERGTRYPKPEILEAIADLFNVDMNYLTGRTDRITRLITPEERAILDRANKAPGYSGRSTPHYTAPEDFARGYWVPVLGDVAAGLPIEAHEDVLDWEQLDEKLRGTGTHFALRIKGTSMEPRMMDGDVVIVRQQADAENGEIVIVKVNGDCATCKRLLKQDDGVTLIPFNPAFPPITYTAEEIKNKPVVILGKVIELRGKF